MSILTRPLVEPLSVLYLEVEHIFHCNKCKLTVVGRELGFGINVNFSIDAKNRGVLRAKFFCHMFHLHTVVHEYTK